MTNDINHYVYALCKTIYRLKGYGEKVTKYKIIAHWRCVLIWILPIEKKKKKDLPYHNFFIN